MNINDREYYMIKRRRKGISLKQIAEYIPCSIALISKWETGQCNIKAEKVRIYKYFIDNYGSELIGQKK